MSTTSYLPLSDEKNPVTEWQDASSVPYRHKSDGQRTILRFIVALSILLVIQRFYGSVIKYSGCKQGESLRGPEMTSTVSLEAHIMSKCPDARDCLQQLVVPTMEKVSDKVDFKLSYIGK